MSTASIAIEQCTGGLLPYHRHQTPHTCLILSGELADREWPNHNQPAGSAEMLLYPAGTAHLIEAGDTGLECAVIEWTDQLTISNTRRFRARQLREATLQLAASLQSDNPARRRIAECETVSNMYAAIQHSDIQPPAGWIHEARDSIRQDVNSITIQQLAAWSGVHRASLSRRFKQAYGVSPEQYKMLLKLEQAADLINSGESLAMAAVTAGFTDQPQLNRVWRHYFGTTPHHWRKQTATIVQDTATDSVA